MIINRQVATMNHLSI